MFASAGSARVDVRVSVRASPAGAGSLLNIMIWFSTFPPSTNPVFDAEHFMFAFILLLLMWLHASNYWGVGRWWRSKTPAFLH